MDELAKMLGYSIMGMAGVFVFLLGLFEVLDFSLRRMKAANEFFAFVKDRNRKRRKP